MGLLLLSEVPTLVREATGTSSGTSTVAGQGKSIATAAGAAAGASSAVGAGETSQASQGLAAGTSTAVAEGKSIKTARGIAAGTSTAIAYSGALSSTPLERVIKVTAESRTLIVEGDKVIVASVTD